MVGNEGLHFMATFFGIALEGWRVDHGTCSGYHRQKNREVTGYTVDEYYRSVLQYSAMNVLDPPAVDKYRVAVLSSLFHPPVDHDTEERYIIFGEAI